MIKKIKSELKHLPMLSLVCIVFYGMTVLADSYAITANEVNFDNTSNSMTTTNMQSAINEIFFHATDYNEIKTTVGNSTLNTTAQTVTGAINEVYGSVVKNTLPDNADANDYWSENGSYYVTSSYTYTNLPVTMGVLTVTRPNMTGTYVTQTVCNNSHCYFRLHSGSTWSGWERLMEDDELAIHEVTVDKSTADSSVLVQNASNKVFANNDIIIFSTYLSTLNPANLTYPVSVGVLSAGDRPLYDKFKLFPVYTSSVYVGYAIMGVKANGTITVEYMSTTGNIIMRDYVSKY